MPALLKKLRKLKRTVAVFLVLMFPLSGIAEAGSYIAETAAEIAEITALEILISLVLEPALINPIEDIIEAEKKRVEHQNAHLFALMAMNERIHTQEYGDDHKPLENQHEAFPIVNDTVLVADTDMPEGYREPSGNGVIYFHQDYKDSMKEWKDYYSLLIAGNNLGAQSVMNRQTIIADMYKAMKDSGHYLRLMQAENQTALLAAREVENMRIDMERQIEARAKFALGERQERTDAHAAFRQALREWRASSANGDY